MPKKVDVNNLTISNDKLVERIEKLGYTNAEAFRFRDQDRGMVKAEVNGDSHSVEVLFDAKYGTEDEAWDRAYKYLADSFDDFRQASEEAAAERGE